MSQFCGMLRKPGYISQVLCGRYFRPYFLLWLLGALPRVVDARGTWRPE
jgi:hypothetical protein